MITERLTQVIVGPHISEKASMIADQANQHVFKVIPGASKMEIQAAVEHLFDVKVASVRTSNVKGKNKMFGRVAGRRKDWKKAYVKLEPGQDIDFGGFE